MRKRNLFFAIIVVFASCTQRKEQKRIELRDQTVLPFEMLMLNDMSAFKDPPSNWSIVKSVNVDRTKKKNVEPIEGTGVLLNKPNDQSKGNLYSVFEHGDIEFECDVLLPVGSNSGIYFQGRYEVQLLDSWGVQKMTYGDMGGIYQRWDKSKEKGNQGYEGSAPIVNASKAPGLWQQLKVVFHAPQFDDAGNKIKNAWFEKVYLNGTLIQKNVSLSGPTRGGIATEVSMAPMMIQGDHGPVAFRNIRYKKYSGQKVVLRDLQMTEYHNTNPKFPNLDSLKAIRHFETDSISSMMATGERPQKLLFYSGVMDVPASGEYLFDFKINRAGGALVIESDTVISMNGNYNLDSLNVGKISMEKGQVPFQLIYNKHVPWQRGFGLYVEGPGVQKHELHAKNSLVMPKNEVDSDYVIRPTNETVFQRSFWIHNGEKRTHCISVGHPKGINYVYDLETGSLLQAWEGDFMSTKKMWQGRGEKQLGEPLGFVVTMHGDLEFAYLENTNSNWPENHESENLKQLGYSFDLDRNPVFTYKIEETLIANKIVPLQEERGLNREIHVENKKTITFKIAEGESIRPLQNGLYIVNDESFYIAFKATELLRPEIKRNNGYDQLLLEIQPGSQKINYSIIW